MAAQESVPCLSSRWPSLFVARMRAWLGDEAAPFFQALGAPETGLRLNPRRGALAELRKRLPWSVTEVPWCPEGVWLQEEGASPGPHPYHTAGVFYVQDPSAMAAAVLLDPRPGEWILDLAAAPGGKSTHIAARMGDEGVLVANDPSRRRAPLLAMNLERMGVTQALVTHASPAQLAEQWPALFDAVLVDAPCSGEGTFAKDPRAVKAWSLRTLARYAARQREILFNAARLVRPGGRILYCTCTFSPEEDEGVIAAFLEHTPGFRLAELPALPGMSPGRPEWIDGPSILQRAGRFWPHRGPGHGHFYALLEREGEPDEDLSGRWTGQAVPGRVLRLYRETLGEVLMTPPPERGLILTADDALFVTPMDPALWQGVSVLRPGWWVATQRHGKIFPDHALAMALGPQDVRRVLRLEVEDPRLRTYLQGSSWVDEGPEGFLLITVEDFPLGWAKRVSGRVRSRYPVHLRRARL